jgi:acylphosphatase
MQPHPARLVLASAARHSHSPALQCIATSASAARGPNSARPGRFDGTAYACRSHRFPAPARRSSDRITALRPGCRRGFPNGVSEQNKARRFNVSGRVQGVGYRYFAHRAAQQHGITGYVKNLRDSRVEVYAIGTEAQLRALREELQQGPRHAVIETVAEGDAELLQEFMSDFSIDYDD